MVWKAIVAALVLTGCPDDTHRVPFCEISVIQTSDGPDLTDINCSDGKKSWEAKLPDLDGWYATDANTLRRLGERLEQCENVSP